MAIKYKKRGWMRILEAGISILVITLILTVIYSNQKNDNNRYDSEDYISNMQKKILKDISSRSDLRDKVLTGPGDEAALEDFANDTIPDMYDFSIRICDLTSPPTGCDLEDTPYIEAVTRGKDIFVEETIISSDLYNFNPRKVRLFVWKAG